MARVHVVMKERQSPIARFPAIPHEVYRTKKQAWDRVEQLNGKSITNHYWVEPAPFIQPTRGTH